MIQDCGDTCEIAYLDRLHSSVQHKMMILICPKCLRHVKAPSLMRRKDVISRTRVINALDMQSNEHVISGTRNLHILDIQSNGRDFWDKSYKYFT